MKTDSVRRGRGVLLNHRLCQTQHPDWSAPDQIQRKKPETPVKPTRIRLNYEPNAEKSAHRTLEPMNNNPSGKSRFNMKSDLLQRIFWIGILVLFLGASS